MYSEYDRIINEVNVIEKIVNMQDCSMELSLMKNHLNMNQDYRYIMSSKILDMITKLNLDYKFYNEYGEYFNKLSLMLSKILDKNIDIKFYKDTFIYTSFNKYFDGYENMNKLNNMISSAKIVEDSFMVFILSRKIAILLDADKIDLDELLETNDRLKKLII